MKKLAKKAAPKKAEAKKKPAKKGSMFKADDYNNFATEYAEISEQIKRLDKRKKELADLLKNGAQSLGNEDAKGSSYLTTNDFLIGRVARVTAKRNDDKGYEFFMKHKDSNGKPMTDCIQQVTKFIVDEDAVAKAVQDKRITMDEVRDNVYDMKTTYQISVRPLEEVDEDEMPEIEQSSLKKG